MDGSFEVAYGDGGGGGYGPGQLKGGAFQVFGRCNGVEKADFEGFAGGEGAACEKEVEGVGASDDAGESLGAAVPGDEIFGEG